MITSPMEALAGLDPACLDRLVDRLAAVDRPSVGRPWSRSLRERIAITCTALRTNLTFRELAAVFQLSRSTAHRIVAAMTRRLASLTFPVQDGRWSWIVDGTLIPTRDHRRAARAKNYRWSCNAQVLVRRRDLAVIATAAGGPGNRNDPIHYRGSCIEQLCVEHGRVLADGGYRGVGHLVTPRFQGRRMVRDHTWRQHRRRRARVEHAIARLKDWRVLRDHRRRGHHVETTVAAVAALHNVRIGLRDMS